MSALQAFVELTIDKDENDAAVLARTVGPAVVGAALDDDKELLFEERHVVAGWKENPVFAGALTKDTYLASGHVVVKIFDRDTFIESILYKRAPGRRIEVIAQSFIQVPWLLRGTKRLSVMHERLAKIAAPVFDLATADAPFVLPAMREMMQHHVTRSNDTGLAWLRERLTQSARAA